MSSKLQILQEICQQINFSIKDYKNLAGGDINEVYLLKSTTKGLVLKLNDAKQFPKMFEEEAKGLQLLQEKSQFKIPSVTKVGQFQQQSYIMMEYISLGKKSTDFSAVFGKQLAHLHQQSNSHFGLDHDNYIGALPQKNPRILKADEFYVYHRLAPQFSIARTKGFEFSNLKKFYKIALELIPDEKPSLIHGDLWNGNYLIDAMGNPALIDPAVAYAPREMDLAMMKLFGGFDEQVFKTYQAVFPLQNNWEYRVELFQLYYLLVHLNIFGRSYLNSVERIIHKYLNQD